MSRYAYKKGYADHLFSKFYYLQCLRFSVILAKILDLILGKLELKVMSYQICRQNQTLI